MEGGLFDTTALMEAFNAPEFVFLRSKMDAQLRVYLPRRLDTMKFGPELHQQVTLCFYHAFATSFSFPCTLTHSPSAEIKGLHHEVAQVKEDSNHHAICMHAACHWNNTVAVQPSPGMLKTRSPQVFRVWHSHLSWTLATPL